MKHLYEALEEYSQSDYYPYHMPGHKRQMTDGFLPQAFQRDITEIDGFDNLHDARGMIKEAEIRAARLYHSEETHFLVNGSTCGILAAVCAVTGKNDVLIMSRNCHKAAYHAALINELTAVWLYPKIFAEFDLCGGITPGQVEEALTAHPEAKAVMITSPTYDGVVSDVKGIVETVHRYGHPLIVDEAHGAHFGFFDGFPETSVRQGADLVIHSVHKTLPSFTQTALLHINGDLVNRERVRRYLSIFQSTSPSYLLMAGIDQCMELLETEGETRFGIFSERLREFYKNAEKLKHLELLNERIIKTRDIFDFDRGKLIISAKRTDISGKEVYKRLLEKYHLQPEMAAGSYCLMIMTMMDTNEGFDRLWAALSKLDEECLDRRSEEEVFLFQRNRSLMKAHEAIDQPKKTVALADSIGKAAAEYIFLYPPGIPLIVPGEEISKTFVEQLRYYQRTGLTICGLKSEKEIEIVWERSTTSLGKVPREKIPYIER